MGKQMSIPGTEREVIPELDEQADKVAEIHNKRLALNTKEKEENTELVERMKKHDKKQYTLDDGRVIKVNINSKATIGKPKPKKVKKGKKKDRRWRRREDEKE